MYLPDLFLDKHVVVAANLGMTETIAAESKTALGCFIENKLALRVLMLPAFNNFQIA
jgi:hypothetical protein